MKDIKQYLEETNTVLVTKEAFESLKERARALDKIRAEIEELRFGQPFRKFVVDECLEIIDKYNTESEKPKQRVGRWEIISGNSSRCSICGAYNPPDYFNRPVIYNYCPFCGAKMEGQP